MAVTTFGDIFQQCLDIATVRETETAACRAIKAAINTAHTKVVSAAIADGLSWLLKTARLPITATTTYVPLPDGLTVLDEDGATPAACRSVRTVRLIGAAVPLHHRSKDLFERDNGILESLGRGVPQYFDPYGYDSNSLGQLWLMPYPSAADVVSIDYIAGSTYLTAPAQVLVPPSDFRELVAQEAIACVNARDTIDGALVAAARENAAFLWRCMFGGSEQYAPMSSSAQQYEGQF